MSDSTIKKVSARSAPQGAMGQTYLVSGKRVAMRLWRDEQPHDKQDDRRDYETVGYVISGRARDRGTDHQARTRRFLARPGRLGASL